MNTWFLYLVRMHSGDLYTGIATDVERRFAEHESGHGKGAKCLRGKGPLELAYQAPIGSRSLASKAEYALKRWSKSRKQALVLAGSGGLSLLKQLDLEPESTLPIGKASKP